jgi:multiple sugar transport system substrate-binding protein
MVRRVLRSRRVTAMGWATTAWVLVIGLLLGSVQAQQPVEITMWFGRQDFIPADAFETFHRENPDIRVKTDVIPLEQAVADVLRTARAGQAPDIVQVPADGVPPLALQGALYEFAPMLAKWQAEEPASYANLAQAAFDLATYEGNLYGVALHYGPYWFTYRVDWFEEAGIAHPPTTWDDVLDAGRVFAADDRIGYSVIGSRAHDPVWFLATYMAMGGQWVDGIPQIDSDAGRYLLAFYQTLIRDGIAHPETLAWASGEMRAAFIGGNAAQAMIGDNIYPTLNESLAYGEQWTGSPPPSRPGGEADNRIMALGWPYVVTAGTEHPEAVLKVLQYLARPEIVAEVALRYQPTTVLPVMNDPVYVEAKPWAPDFAAPFAELVPLPSHPRQPQVYQILLDAMQDALQNPNADAAEMAARYQAQLDELR